ncbi:LysR family transcriptional regulator [Mangrovitalea sediminis]|uniref:LysR family transcriptional regulator n=1 Tax=Mangrovitalea sediminis TaxID=1982043 RepID=UPI000BE5EB10|nr:LysR family transcriptional regulator [Mangrovitalea sediminis]
MNNIIENDLRRLDLNLLLAFRALMQERSVTLAAERLFLGQPAMSGALKRLRAAFGDELFVRTPQGMVPTPRAQELWRRIEPLLASLHQALTQPAGFVPAEAQRVFNIGLTDSLGMALMPELMGRLTDKAPGVQVVTRQAADSAAPDMLDAGEIDLGVGVFKQCAPWHCLRPLFRWSFVCVYDPQQISLAGDAITLQEYLAHRHVLTSFHATLTGYIDELLAEQNLQRRVIYAGPNFATNPFILKRIPAITTVPDFTARLWRDTLGLAISPIPLAVPDYEVSLLWAAANDREPGLRWLIGECVDAFATPALPI